MTAGHASTRTLGALLILVVLTQLAYVVTGGGALAAPIWTIEVFAFALIALLALAAMREPGGQTVFAAIVLFGLFNTLQAGMGLAMFDPLIAGGEPLQPAFEAVLAGAFLFYFVGKVMIGVAAVAIGAALRRQRGPHGIVGIVALLAGAAAVVANAIGAAAGREAVLQVAGTTGTLATLLVGVALLLTKNR